MMNRATREGGFLPILVLIVIFAVSAVSGVALYYKKERSKPNLTQSQPQPTYSPPATSSVAIDEPTNYAPSPHTSPSATKVIVSQSATPVPNISPVSSITPKVQIKISTPSENLTQLFAVIEQEVLDGKAKGSLFSTEHSSRIFDDLNDLERKGYLKSEIERLRQIVIELSPDLKDQAVPSPSPVASSTPSASSQDANCLKTNPTLTTDISDFAKIQKITAPGSASSEGPKGHSFIWTNGERVPVYAPIAGILESGAYSKDNESSPAQYLLMFKVKGNCDFQFKFDHIDEPVDVIRLALPSVPKVADSRGTFVTETIAFNAGDLIGYTKGNIPSGNWDFGLYNMAEKGALKDSYGLHSNAVCWVDFYSSAKQQQYRNLLEGPKLVCSF